MTRIAVVLMNLGGPDSPAAVRPFLYNLFSDPAIIDLPTSVRRPLAWLIARQRSRTAAEIYSHLGGSSPLLANTEAQARALESELGPGYRCFIAMRYWHPLTAAALRAVKEWQPDEIVLLPLYPQFSTTTVASSLAAWHGEAQGQGLACPTRAVPAYPTEPGFIAAVAGLVDKSLAEAAAQNRPVRLLLSAHGLPLKIVRKGDPYPQQVESTATAVVAALERSIPDWRVCYQSRVGPLAWLGPSVEEELRAAGRDGAAVVIAPISFVSEHSETLVELDRDYRRLAEACGVRFYARVPTVVTEPHFIAGLARLVREQTETSLAGVSAVAAAPAP
jgi:protoporphyrin/coproporphyrin ferrochelatase